MPIRTVALMVGGSQDFLKHRIARTFFFRYHYCGVPKHMEYLEEARHHMSCAPAEPIFSRNWIAERLFGHFVPLAQYFRGSIPDFSGKINMKAPLCHFQKKVSCHVQIFLYANRLGPRLSVVPVFPGPAEGRKEGQPRYQEIVRSLSEPWSGLDQPRFAAFDFRSKSLRAKFVHKFCTCGLHIFFVRALKGAGILILSTCTT
jgi:hypothetical protein